MLKTSNLHNSERLKFTFGFSIAVGIVVIMWLIKLYELSLHISFAKLGVMPQTLLGLRGIIFSPFIHSNISHLFANSFPLLILITTLLYFYPAKGISVFFIIYIFSGVLLWLIGRQSYHIGASGVIYGLVSYTFFGGILSKKKPLIAVSLIIVFLYGGTIWGILPQQDSNISWEAHLSGFVSGTITSVFIYDKNGRDFYLSNDNKFDYQYNFIYFCATNKMVFSYKFFQKYTSNFNYHIHYEIHFDSFNSCNFYNKYYSTTVV